ncbi:MAG: bifunctional phosphoribosyl-AMP cyclohydrolase/phosphoribosyl-ATP diphosphatase HisIE [Nitrospiraceae bacterium]
MNTRDGQIVFDEQGLLPAVIQDWRDGSVLMLGYMNRESLTKTLETRSVHFWSRSRQRLWEKGETSGHRLLVKDLFVDCDRDTVLVKVEPTGPTCHTGERSCFFSRMTDEGNVESKKAAGAFGGILERVYETILDRRAAPKSGSYVSMLLQGGADRILKKVAEEAGEVLLAAKNGKREDIVYEVADLLFHTLLVLGYHDITLGEVYQELASRFGEPGLRQNKT